MSNILIYILIFFMAVFGGLSTIYVVISLPAVIIYKILERLNLRRRFYNTTTMEK